MPLAPVLMVQGTSSHAGKSTLVSALCRWFANRGVAVAPYKAQNMSLNAGVTPDGHEIGRAQLVQAAAARAVPHVDMNPVLLKPHAETASQVVVLGKAEGVRDARNYFEQRDRLWPVVRDALDRLRSSYDLVIAEGAGSPAEINLADRDIVNMRIARHAGAAVVIVGDIERGGVFASLAGTMLLLPEGERALVRGFVINKFRGDVTLVEPGPAMLEARTGVPTLGVVPFYRGIDVPEEDALGADPPVAGNANALLDIAIVQLPHLANFDDFDPLRRRPGVSVRFVRDVATLGTPDLIILPGSKTTIPDLRWLREAGFTDRIRAHRASGRAVLGICGGHQMLGVRLEDPLGIETAGESIDGLGMLPHRTVFAETKRTRLVRAALACDGGPLGAHAGLALTGFEMHHGDSGTGTRPFAWIEGEGGTRTADGGTDEEGLTLGTYLHGVLNSVLFREALLAMLAQRKGVTLPPAGLERPLDQELDRLAEHFAAHVDFDRIAGWVGLA